LESVRIKPSDVPAEWAERVLGGPLVRDASAMELLRRPEVNYDALLEVAGAPVWMQPAGATDAAVERDDRLPAQIRAQIEVRAKYAGYIERQEDEIERHRRNEETPLPDNLDYSQVSGLSHEVRQKLSEARPATIGLAGRLPGMTPAAVSILLVHLKKRGYGVRAQVA
jgi:tRNA uridine 5-carboxymethylaminomethyl modification enzyme